MSSFRSEWPFLLELFDVDFFYPGVVCIDLGCYVIFFNLWHLSRHGDERSRAQQETRCFVLSHGRRGRFHVAALSHEKRKSCIVVVYSFGVDRRIPLAMVASENADRVSLSTELRPFHSLSSCFRRCKH